MNGNVLTHIRPAAASASINVGRQPGDELRDYRGRVTLLAFWGTWCRPCAAEAPLLVELKKRYGPLGFSILGIHSGRDEPGVRAFAAEYGMDWPQILEESGSGMIKLFRVGKLVQGRK